MDFEKLYCSVCEESLDSRETEKKDAKVDGMSFNFTDKELIAWVNDLSTASVGSTELELLGGTNTSYRITLSDGEAGAFLLNHGDNGADGNICGIMVYFEDTANSGAMAAWIGEKIDSKFSSEAAFEKFAVGDSYTSADMTVVQLSLDDDFSVYLLAPSEYIVKLLS